MAVLVAPASTAVEPRPFLLSDQFDALGQLVVVRDEDWDDIVKWTQEHLLLPDREVTIVETQQGPFMFIPDEDIDQTKRETP